MLRHRERGKKKKGGQGGKSLAFSGLHQACRLCPLKKRSARAKGKEGKMAKRGIDGLQRSGEAEIWAVERLSEKEKRPASIEQKKRKKGGEKLRRVTRLQKKS